VCDHEMPRGKRPLAKTGDWLTTIDPRGDEFCVKVLEDETEGMTHLRVLLYSKEIRMPVKEIGIRPV